jgi:Asp-tRNA(Asn)/Glu-tRNA(Gln) amidotransferase A subunit family amidase
MPPAPSKGSGIPPQLETLSQWLQASRLDRELAVVSAGARIRREDKAIQAWVQVEPQPILSDGPLVGVPFGAKEIIETRGLETAYGTSLYAGRIGTEDAAIVRLVRERGAVLMGKTRSTAFAYFTPGPTRNPRNHAHTPGGSSSGSAAAVAAGMVPVALGTQTAGSILRPASYCGVAGFKASFGLLPMDGVLPFASSLDTLGFFAHRAEDMAVFWQSLGYDQGAAGNFAVAVPDPLPAVDVVMGRAFQDAVAHLRRGGVTIQPIALAETLDRLRAAHRTIMYFEGARFHEARFREHGSRLGALAALVEEGLRISVLSYDEARRAVALSRRQMSEQFKYTPVILTPAAVGPAPAGLSSTGDPRMNAPWTALGTPALSIPMPTGIGLPLGLQLTADHGQDGIVIRTGVRLERILGAGL